MGPSHLEARETPLLPCERRLLEVLPDPHQPQGQQRTPGPLEEADRSPRPQAMVTPRSQ